MAQSPDRINQGLQQPRRPGAESISDRLIVQERLGADSAAIVSALEARGAKVLRRQGSLNVAILSVDPAQRDQVQAELESSGLFNYVEPDYVATVHATPNDPSYPSQWHMATIQAASAWNISTGSSAITIGVIDSGADWNHPDLAGRLVPGWSFLTGTSNTQDTMGHGTATSGTIAAATDNSTGVAGVTWQNPIMPLQVVDSTGYASYSNIASAITYAADHGIRIVNISIGGTSSSSTMQNAINYAWGKGTVIFASAGNGGSSMPYYPGACQNVVAVSATNSSDVLSSFSSYGSYVSLSAPGEAILTTSSGGGYGYWSGTSFSSPIAAAVGALVLSNSPGLSAQALVNVLKNNSDDLGAVGYDQYFGFGRVNAYRALTGSSSSSDTTPPSVSLSNPVNGSTVQASVSVQGTATDNVGVSRVEFYVDGNLKGTAYSSPFLFTWDSTTASNAAHTLAAKAFDSSNNMGQASVSVTVNNPPPADTQAPTVSVTSPANGQTVTGSIQISASASDNVGVTQVTFYVDGILQNTDSGAPYGFTYDTTKLTNGAHSITAKAWDQAGNFGTSAAVSVNASNSVPVPDTQAPTVSVTSPYDGQVVQGSIQITASAADNVGVTQVSIYVDGAFYSSTAGPNSYTAAYNTSTLPNGTHSITARAWDAAGNVGVSAPVNVTVNNPLPPSDTQPPTVSIQTPIKVNGNSAITITAFASDNVGVKQVSIYVDGVLQYSDSVAPYSFSKKYSNGTHSVYAIAKDNAGNTGYSTVVTFKK